MDRATAPCLVAVAAAAIVVLLSATSIAAAPAAAAPAAAAPAAAPGRALLQDCKACTADYSLRARTTSSSCNGEVCLWFTDVRGPDGVHGCWDVTQDWSTLSLNQRPIWLDTRKTLHFSTRGDANNDSPQLEYRAIPGRGSCATKCGVPQGYQADFAC